VTAVRAARAAAVLFIVTASLFVLGVSTEPGPDGTSEATGSHDASTEGEAAHDEAAHDEAPPNTGSERHSSRLERWSGISRAAMP
jgi:hypothetical protein